ncbi:MAG: hypothetical protein M3Y59_14475 [Myxococcota bacterium]|nr:hypothetical protein [Myxococcota bacterium]
MLRGLLWVLLATAGLGCNGPARTGTRPDSKIGSDPLSHVELVISGLSRSDAEAFRGQILAQGDLSEVVLKSYANNVATFELDVRGCECDLPAKIAQLRSHGFRYEGRTSRLKYTALDNQPPVISFVHPENERVLSEADQLVAVEVRDSDVDEVRVNGVKADRFRGDVFLAKLRLADGSNEIEAVARDKAGNETRSKVRVSLNRATTTEATLRVVVEGRVPVGSTVLVEGQEVPVDTKGRYRVEVPIALGQRQIEIIAIASDGRKSVTVKELSPK